MTKKVPKEHPAPQKMKFMTKNKKISYIGGFWFLLVRSPTSPNFKTHKTFVLQGFLLYTNTSIPKLYTILLSRDLKNKKVGLPPPPTAHPPPNKKIIFGYKSEILIRYKRIKWNPSRKALLLLPGG